MFFQRIRFDLRELHTDRVALERGIAEVARALRHDLARSRYDELRKRVAIFVSQVRPLPVRPAAAPPRGRAGLRHRAGGQQPPGLGDVAAQFGVPFHHLPIDKANKARAGSSSELELLERERVDLIVLARYMQILSADVRRALSATASSTSTTRSCPRSSAASPYHQAHERGVKLIGATAHYVTERAGRRADHRAGRDARTRTATPSRTWCARAATWRRSCWRAPCGGTSRTASSSTATRPSSSARG